MDHWVGIMTSDNEITYKDAGVDIEKEAKGIDALKAVLSFSREGFGRPLALEGHFTGLIDFGDKALSLCTDGVGTKVLIAQALNKWDTVGIDCIAMNANDMICVGAEPLAFVDYLAVEEVSDDLLSEIAKGLNEGARLANLSIIGGETATVPEIVNGFDLAGTCLGFVSKDEIITGASIGEGDRIIALRSSGIHSNGLTLARKVFTMAGSDMDEPFPVIDALGGKPAYDSKVGEVLLTPTRIYVRQVLDVISKFPVHGLAHITGGGVLNIPRLRKDVAFKITDPVEPQAIFRAIQVLGNVTDREMYQTFNMGMGFVLVVPNDAASDLLSHLNRERQEVLAFDIGEVCPGTGVSVPSMDLIWD